jgi:uncharacterized protein involved in exopolysaccharide biosynthesis
MTNGMPDKEQILKLREDCSSALRRFVEQANQTCEMLQTIEPKFPPAIADRQRIMEQRQSENLAYEDYQASRRKLFEVARWPDP